MKGITGAVVAVTGAAGGIGLATARMLGAEGAKVALLDVDGVGAESAAAAIRAAGGVARAWALDVRDAAATARVMDAVEAELGPLYGFVPCAGTTRSARSEEMSREAWDLVIELNLTAVFLGCQDAGRRMLRHGRGAIVTVSSLTGMAGQSGRANYSASKWAVIGLTKTLAVEWGGRGIRVNGIAPHMVETPLLLQGVPHDFIYGVAVDRTPAGRIAKADEMAGAILFLLSDLAGFVNGQVLPVDGGATAGFFTHKSGRHFGSNAIPFRE